MRTKKQNENINKEDIQEKLFNIQSLAKVLKLASGTSYKTQIDDTDIQVVTDFISNEAQKIINKLGV